MAIVTHEQLQDLTGLRQRGAMRRALREAGIPFREIAGRLMTTDEAITAALVGRGKKRKGPNFEAITEERPAQAR